MGANMAGTDLTGAVFEVEEFARRGWLKGAVIGPVTL